MPLTTIAGNIQIPTGAAANSARLVFTLASWDIGGDVVYAPDPTVEPLAGTAYSIPLESTTDKERQSAYKVELLWYSTARRATMTEVLGVIPVPPSGGPFALPDLLSVPITTPVPADILALCQAYAASAAGDASAASASAVTAVNAAAAASADADTVAALVEGYYGNFLTTDIDDGVGPYALSVNPTDARAMTLTVNGLRYAAPDHFTLVAMAGSPSGFGVLLADPHPPNMRGDYSIILPRPVVVSADVFREGNGSPEGAVAADPGTLYLQRDGLRDGTLWIKNTGVGSTGWIVSRHKYRNISAVTYSATTAITKEVGSGAALITAQFTSMGLATGAAAYDVTVTLSKTNAVSGDYFDFYLNLPSSADRRVVFLNGTDGPELLVAATATSDRFKGRFVYNGANWISAGFSVCVFD